MNNAILLTPVIPNPNGIGIEKRAYQWYSKLNKEYKLDILLVDSGISKLKVEQPIGIKNIIYFSPETKQFVFLKRMKLSMLSLLKAYCPENAPFMTWIPITNKDKNVLKNVYRDFKWDKIFCFRLFISQFALFLSSHTGCINIEIDFDDFESQTQKSLGVIHLKNWNLVKALGYFISSLHYKYIEKLIISKNLKYYISADIDRISLLKKHNKFNLETFNNTINMLTDTSNTELTISTNKHPHILFVGSLNYYPNEDAVKFFIKHILNDLNKLSSIKWKFHIIGKGCSNSLSKWLNKQLNVVFYGETANLSPIYKACDMVVIPIRGGGGTKIKAIEAIIHFKPLISTFEGVRDLGLIPSIHYYHAETKKEWIESCVNAWVDQGKSEIMVKKALWHITQKRLID